MQTRQMNEPLSMGKGSSADMLCKSFWRRGGVHSPSRVSGQAGTHLGGGGHQPDSVGRRPVGVWAGWCLALIHFQTLHHRKRYVIGCYRLELARECRVAQRLCVRVAPATYYKNNEA